MFPSPSSVEQPTEFRKETLYLKSQRELEDMKEQPDRDKECSRGTSVHRKFGVPGGVI